MKKNSILNVTQDKKVILKKIVENMIKIRPRGEVVLRPYFNPGEIISKRYAGAPLEIDFGKIFKSAKKGDFVYFKTNIYTDEVHTAAVSVNGNADVFYKGELIIETRGDVGKTAHIETVDGESELLVKAYCDGEGFKVKLSVSPPAFPGLCANDYLMWNRITSPLAEFSGEDGFVISPLFKAGKDVEWDGIKRAYPPAEEDDKIIDFTSLYGIREGKYAIAFTKCEKDGILKIDTKTNNRIYCNGSEIDNESVIKKGDQITIVSKCVNNKWGFESFSNECFGIDFIKTGRKYAHWIVLGYFDDETVKDNIYFDDVYYNSEGKKAFWRFPVKDTYLRPYLDTCFFGKWYYALMVGHYGILNASEFMGEEYREYFKDSISILAKYYEYMDYERDIFIEPTFLSKSWYLDNLDSIGSMGMNLCELYKMTNDEKVMKLLKLLIKSANENIPRFVDGTFYRHPIPWCDGTNKHIMWSDDTYMSCPFFVRMGEITGENKYYVEASNQLKGFFKRLYMESEQLMSHVYFVDDDFKGGTPWGRGNGWMFYTIADVLENIPDDLPERDELLAMYKAFLEGVEKNIDDDGMWHQVLNCTESYKETSCSAMFIAGIAKGIKNGWIPAQKYKPLVEKAWRGLAKNAIDEDGTIYGVCKGSGCHWEQEYYMKLGTVVNDDHGTGIVLTALCEIMHLED